MKRIIKITGFVLLIAIGAVSCQKFLTIVPQDQQVLETYYTSEEAVNNNTASLYTAFIWQPFHMFFMWLAGDLMSGDMFYTFDQEGQFYYMTFNGGNKHLTDGWNGLYNVISFCNGVINGMPPAARGNGVSEEVITRGVAEARCIRAIAYYYLAEYWGDVPIIEDNNMSSGDIVRHYQSDVYEFMRREFEYAKDALPLTPYQPGRCTKWTAKSWLAKLHLTMASHLDDANSADNFAKAKAYAEDVINNSGLSLYPDFGDLFYPLSNNNPESIFAIQCTSNGYGYGSMRNVHHSRNALVTLGLAYGPGKGPTLSLQEIFNETPNDLRRASTFMRNGDHFGNLGGGGYDYANYSDDEKTETPNEMLAHVRKYIIGGNQDCDGLSGNADQDAGGNLYLLRLADVYLCYVEACIGEGTSTSDALALDVFGRVQNRAGLTFSGFEITYTDLIKERRKEFAFESNNIFDIKRMFYRNQTQAINYLNGMERHRQYYNSTNWTPADCNATGIYHGGFAVVDPEDDPDGKGSYFWYNTNISPVTFTPDLMTLKIPTETVVKTPRIMEDPQHYNF
ncbi:MAG: RagB/SusD family nutrient uptake outer membrane protein [Bacteroidales bacterium]|jgi:hypothetical protein|nr:RagB/SusD family nutrient uptake outer membrane protein [Bacteroidales bacterium]